VRIALDAQLAVGTATGIGVYQRDLARALGAAGIDVRPLQFPALDPWRFDRRVLWDQVLLPAFAARSGAQLLHAASGTMPLVRPLPTVVTVHDMAWLRVQSHTRAYARAYFGGLMKRLYRGAAAIITDSAFARDEFLTLAGARSDVHVVYPGVDARFAAIERRPQARPLALVVGTVERRKNLVRAIETLAAVPELDLVAVGPPTPYLDEVRARISALGLGDRVTVLLEDYRSLTGQYDKLVSIEMIEAVGAAYLGHYFAQLGRLLRSSGLALLQAITIEDHRYAQALKSVDFIKRHVFPGSFMPSIQAMLAAKTETSDLALVHLEDFGLSYARTLEAWRQRFLALQAEVRNLKFDEPFIRLWEFYLAYCEGGFRERSIGVAHLLFAKPGFRGAAPYAGDAG